MKTPFSTIAGLAVGLLVGVTATVQAQFNYEIHEGTVTITGYTGPGGDVVIPDIIEGKPVTSIGDHAFGAWDRPNTSLTSVTIPDSVTSIGDDAFYGCGGLTSVTIHNGSASIGGFAFFGCDNLDYVKVGSGAMLLRRGPCPDGAVAVQATVEGLPVTHLGDGMFSGCTGLTSITIPDSVTSIGWYTFQGCTSLASIVIPGSVTSIQVRTFEGCSSLTSVVIPDGVTSIGDYAFWGCTSLSGVTIPGSVTGRNRWITTALVVECKDGAVVDRRS